MIAILLSMQEPQAASNCVSQSLFVNASAGEMNCVVVFAAKIGANAAAAA